MRSPPIETNLKVHPIVEHRIFLLHHSQPVLFEENRHRLPGAGEARVRGEYFLLSFRELRLVELLVFGGPAKCLTLYLVDHRFPLLKPLLAQLLRGMLHPVLETQLPVDAYVVVGAAIVVEERLPI